MKLVPQKVGGADRKKLYWLGGLMLVFVIVLLVNRDSGAPEAHTTSPLSVTPVAATPARTTASSPAAPKRSGSRNSINSQEYRPTLKLKDGVDITKIDPTLKIDLLAKVNSIPLETGSRGSVFDWGKAPPPPPPPVDPIKPGTLLANAAGRSPIPTSTPRPPTPPPAPPPQPIPLKFYGFSARTGSKRAFFLDGDDIAVAGENEVIKNRYKVIKIGVNSVVVEDLTNKNQQTLPLIEELAG